MDFTQDTAITYAKIGKFVLFGFVEIPKPRRWKGTKLHVHKGLFGNTGVEMPHFALEFLFDRAWRLMHNYSNLSPRQQAKIQKSYEQNLDRADQSETVRALEHDVYLFGKFAFYATQPETDE